MRRTRGLATIVWACVVIVSAACAAPRRKEYEDVLNRMRMYSTALVVRLATEEAPFARAESAFRETRAAGERLRRVLDAAQFEIERGTEETHAATAEALRVLEAETRRWVGEREEIADLHETLREIRETVEECGHKSE